MEIPKSSIRLTITASIVILAIMLTAILYYRSINRPWTRDGQVRAEIIKIATQINGEIIKVAVKDNQKVKKGVLLFQIDPKDFKLKVKGANIQLDQARQTVKSLQAQVKAAEAMIEQRKAQLNFAQTEKRRIMIAAKTNAVSKARVDQAVASVDAALANLNGSIADLEQAKQNLGVPGENNVRIRNAKVNINLAKLKLSWTSIYAPSDGYVTNLELKEGDYAFLGIPKLAFVDSSSFWIAGFFKETQLKYIKPGDRAVVTLMSNRDKPIEGIVNSIGRAISTSDTAKTENLLPEISATFDWVRLAQRIPVRIEIKKVPADVELIVGTTASVAVFPTRGRP